MRTLSIHLTDLCNSKCSFCVVGSPLYKKDSIDFERIQAFLLANASKGFHSVNIHGGEATIHPRFLDVLEMIRSLGYPEVHLQTNGIRLADSDFAKETFDRGVRLYIVSLHGHVAQLQDEQTGSEGGFEKTIVGIRNVKSQEAKVRINTVITRQNVEHLWSIVQLAIEMGVDQVNFSNLHPVGSAAFSFENVVPELGIVRSHLYRAIDHALSNGREVTLEGFPYCTVKEYSHLHLNEVAREIRMLMRGQVIESYDQFMNSTCRRVGAPCSICSIQKKCGGVYPEYVQRFGWDGIYAISN